MKTLDDIKDFPNEVNGWELTDDSNFQYVKRRNDMTYSLIEITQYGCDDGLYEVYHDTIDFTDYFTTMQDELKEILNEFGYVSVDDVICMCGDLAVQIICECIFEHYGSHQANQLCIGDVDMVFNSLINFIKEN